MKNIKSAVKQRVLFPMTHTGRRAHYRTVGYSTSTSTGSHKRSGVRLSAQPNERHHLAAASPDSPQCETPSPRARLQGFYCASLGAWHLNETLAEAYEVTVEFDVVFVLRVAYSVFRIPQP